MAGDSKTTKGGAAKSLAKGDVKGVGKTIAVNFLINEIPVVGPIAASKTWLAFKEFKNDLTSPKGIFMMIIAPICDLISFFFPLVGPVISSVIYWPLALLFGNKSQASQESAQTEKEQKGGLAPQTTEPQKPSLPKSAATAKK